MGSLQELLTKQFRGGDLHKLKNKDLINYNNYSIIKLCINYICKIEVK
uniref:Uncharacterized protein n=1 Tax=Meloidogyne enterolobii TaxID=390850 RepID=A0A6V7TI81_MELEN|nr:unnamed protein product [Meloidogyne enterolobii]